jgi:hypothetical protein
MRLLLLILLSAVTCRAQVVPTHLMAGQQANSGSPTVAFSVNGGHGHTTAAASLTYSLSGIGSGTHLMGIVYVQWGNSPNANTVSSVTWAGVTMTAAGAASCTTSSSNCAEIFYLAAPGTGSPSIVVTMATTETYDIWSTGATFTGVNQTTPVRSGTYTTSAVTSSLSVSLTITSQVGDMTTSAVISEDGTVSTNQTVINNSTTGSARTVAGSDYAVGAASITDTWTGGSTTHMGACGFSLAAG